MNRQALSIIRAGVLATASSVLAAGALASGPAYSQEVLPAAAAPFKGQIGLSVKDSVPDFPLPVQAPKGAPNVLLILLDDVGFGASSTFGGPVATPTLERLAQDGLRYTQFHTTVALLADARGADHRSQPSLGAHRGHHGNGDGLSRLRQPDGQGHRDGRRDPQAERMEHRVVRQEPQRAGLADEPGRAVRPLADGSGLRALLWVHRRGDQPVAAGRLRRHAPDRALPRQAGLQLRLRHRRPGHPVGPQPEGGRAGPAVLHLLRAGCDALPAPPEEGVDREVQGQVRPGLGQDTRADDRSPEDNWASFRPIRSSRSGIPESRRGTRSTPNRRACTPT